jgi:hypothetical protein
MGTKRTTQGLCYRGCTLERTSITTDGTRLVFGTAHPCIKHIWRITGRLTTDGLGQQWLTSAALCREWIREMDARAEVR